ncbi:tetratricopeptide repeat protein [Methylomonas sp. MED-D]|uniref:tetratricopeptide repeat protein n=1 Tax=unclassified Methylomonas TaxID=2608980 RepID=UPI0028A2EC0B|nr:tetratricopeptide repeat protein [Methylomonas sp. MV1]MDT4331035.1 tetratricopeptide repeat protein [Methylomonas sp. MV1]
MKKSSLLVLFPLVLLLSACAGVSESERPSPTAGQVAAKKAQSKKNPAAKDKAPIPPVAKKAQASVPGTGTYAIEEVTTNFKDEPNLPAFRAEPLTPPVESAATTPVAPTAEAVRLNIEDAQIPSGTSPAVVALVSEADRSRNAGDLDAAVVVMERALRIDARNPLLTYKLALLRLKQNKAPQAEELAGKAALLAGGDLSLKRKSWLLISEARQMQQNPQGAKEAKAKADSFFGH